MSHVEFVDEEQFEKRQPRIKMKKSNSFVQGPNDVLVEMDSNIGFFTDRRVYNMKCVARILIFILFNFGLVYLCYLFFSLHKCCKYLGHKHKSLAIKRRYLVYQLQIYQSSFILDFILCLSQACVYFIFAVGYSKYHQLSSLQKEYFLWSINGILLTFLFMIFMTYKELYILRQQEIQTARYQANKDSTNQLKILFHFKFSDLISFDNFNTLGLGHFQNLFKEEMKDIPANHKQEFTMELKAQVDLIIAQQNMDHTMIFFTMITDQDNNDKLDKTRHHQRQDTLTQPPASVKYDEDQLKMLSRLKKAGFKGNRDILTNFLLPHYLRTRDFSVFDPRTRWITVMMMILIKILFPTLYYISTLSHEVVIYSVIFTLFYLQIGQTIYELVINDDLKTKTYIYKCLMKVIDINEVKSKSGLTFDLACNITLQSWDTVRRITLMLEQKKQTRYNFVFVFLALYGKICFLAFILCRLKVKIFKNYNYCKEDIFLFNIHIDASFVVVICMLRIYEGQQFNDAFAKMKDMCHRLAAIYEDLFTLYDFYFSDIGAIQDSKHLIFTAIDMIRKEIGYRSERDKNDGQDIPVEEDKDENARKEQLHKLAFEKVRELKGTMEKIAKSVTKDEAKFSVKFMGVDFHKFVKVAMVVALSYVPSLFKKMSTYLNQLT